LSPHRTTTKFLTSSDIMSNPITLINLVKNFFAYISTHAVYIDTCGYDVLIMQRVNWDLICQKQVPVLLRTVTPRRQYFATLRQVHVTICCLQGDGDIPDRSQVLPPS
jgi:hypothetical protein